MKSSKKTWRAVYSTFGPYAIANALMLIAIVLMVIFQPDLSGPSNLWTAKTIWSCIAISAVMLVAGGFVIQGGFRLRKVNQSAREDRRRVEAGLPLDPEEPGDKDG